MAAFLASRAPTEVVERRWTVPLDADDGAESASLSASGVTVDAYEFQGGELVLTLSGGTAAATGSIVATITTSQGRTLVETLYIPVVASASQIADTARSYCYFALRKITGNGNDPEASELDDALERLEGLVAKWRAGGADIGAPFPLTAASVIYCPDWAVDALRFNLRIACHDHYDAPLTAYDVQQAMRGRQLVAHKNLPATREGAEFY
jgi:hypothetical protein